MTLNFPNRFVWIMIGAIILFLLQGGCQPIQPPAAPQPTVASEEADRATLSTNVSNETPSPNGDWLATTLFQIPRASEEYFQSLVVTHASGAPSYTLVEGWFPLGLGYTVAEPLTWSQDGERFYYTNRANPDGCALLVNGSDLYRVDLATGETTELLPPHTTTTLALAPDEKHVVYRMSGEPTLHIHDLNTGKVTPFDLTPLLGSGDQFGAFIWSPDSSAFAFVIAHNPCIGGWAETTSIYVIDIHDPQELTLMPHLQRDDRLLSPVAWQGDDALILENQGFYNQLDQKGQFMLDLATNEVTPISDQ